MLLDHIAWFFVRSYTPAWELMHFFGRITGPAMAVFVAEGYRYTKDVNKYTLRLGLFALVSWPCFSLMEYGEVRAEFGVIYTLFLALIALRIYDLDIHWVFRLVMIAGLCWLSMYGDWPILDILIALIAHIWYDNKELRWTLHSLVSLGFMAYIWMAYMSRGWPWWYPIYELGEFLVPLIFIFLYNGESGSKKPFHKWFFYLFYPLHMLVLWYLRYKPFGGF